MADKENDTANSTKIGISTESEMMEKKQKESATGAIRKMFDDTRTRKAVREDIIGKKNSPEKLSPMDDPMNVRNTDTGNLKKMMENTKTRKTVKLKPLSGQKPIQLEDEEKPAVKASSRQTIKLKAVSGKPDKAQANDLKKIHDEAISKANARQTVKLKTVKKPEAGENTSSLAKEKKEKDTSSGKAIKTARIIPNTEALAKELDEREKKKAEAKPVTAGDTAKIGSETEAPSDPLKNRDSNTGTLKKMADTNKTRQTVKLKAVKKSAPGPNTSSLAKEREEKDTSSGKAIKTARIIPNTEALAKELDEREKKKAAAKSMPPGDTAKIGSETDAPADPLKKRDSNTGTMKKVLDDTKTRKTVKLRKQAGKVDQQAETVVEGAAPVTGAVPAKGRSSQTQKFKARQTQSVKARKKKAGKSIVPSAKDTIKLRPSKAGDKAAPTSTKANAKKQTIRMAPIEATKGSDTIKLTKKPQDPAKKAIPAKTAGVQKAKLVEKKSAKVVGSEILATETAKATTTDGDVKKAKVVAQAKFATDTAHTISLEEGSKSGLSLPKRPTPPPKKSNAPTAPTQKLEIPDENEMELPKPGGLKVKQSDAPEGAGAPIAQKGEEEYGTVKGKKKKKKKKKAGTQEASVFYTVFAVASLILLTATAFISAAQYINLWEQQRIGKSIPIPMIDDFISKIGD